MFCNSFHVTNFRSFTDLKLEQLGRVNLIVGKNNVGKTSVLEALRLFSSGGSFGTLIDLALERESVLPLERAGSPTLKRLAAGVFRNYAIDDEKINLSALNASVEIKLARYQWVSDEDADSGAGRRRYLTEAEIADLLKGDPDVDLREAILVDSPAGQETYRVDREAPRSIIETYRSRATEIQPHASVASRLLDTDDLASVWDTVALTDSESIVVDALRLVEPSIAGVAFVEAADLDEVRRRVRDVVPNRTKVRRVPLVRIDGSNLRVPLRSMGDGLQRTLDVVLRLAAIKSGAFLIDEFENGVHYSLQPKLWSLIYRVAAERNLQVFATTHSDDCVKAFAEVGKGSKEDGVLFRLSRSGTDEPHSVRRYTEEALLDALGVDLEVR